MQYDIYRFSWLLPQVAGKIMFFSWLIDFHSNESSFGCELTWRFSVYFFYITKCYFIEGTKMSYASLLNFWPTNQDIN